MNTRKTLLVLAFALASTGCATMGANYTPLIDTQGTDPVKLSADLKDCQFMAHKAATVAQGAVVGAVFAGLLGAALIPSGHYSHGIANRALLLGAASGAATTTDTRQTIIKRCMAGRGYSVLN